MRKKQTATSGMDWNTMIGLTLRLKKDKLYKDYLLITVGCYFDLRIGDLLSIRWIDVLGKEELVLTEQKTKKLRSITINPNVTQALDFCLQEQNVDRKFNENDFIFSNRWNGQLSISYINKRLKFIFKKYNVVVRNARHKDSLGTEVEIKPGAVNWMTAGKGIVHSERTPEYLRHSDKKLHGLQIWVALPKVLEQMEPSFSHIDADKIPSWQQDGVSMKLIAGEAFKRKSPVPVYSPLYFIEIKNTVKQKLNMGEYLFGESAIYILEGSVQSEGNIFEPKHFLVAKDSKLCEFELSENSTVYIFGGEQLPEERFIFWNFVSSDKTLIEKAKTDWAEQKFPKVPGETEFVPLPNQSLKR